MSARDFASDAQRRRIREINRFDRERRNAELERRHGVRPKPRPGTVATCDHANPCARCGLRIRKGQRTMVSQIEGRGVFVHAECEHTPGPGFVAPMPAHTVQVEDNGTTGHHRLSKAQKEQIRQAVRSVDNRKSLDDFVHSWCRFFKCHPESVRQTVLQLANCSGGDITVENIEGVDLIEVVRQQP